MKHVFARFLGSRQTANDRSPPPPRASIARSTYDESTAVDDGKPMCVDKGVRNASLAIYVLRHTSSPALAPAAHPFLPRVSATLPATPRWGHPSRTSDPSFRPPPRLASGAARRTMPPPHRRTNARPFRSTVSAGSCHHRTGLRTPPDDTAPINRDPVSSPADTFFRNAPFSRSSGSRKKCL